LRLTSETALLTAERKAAEVKEALDLVNQTTADRLSKIRDVVNGEHERLLVQVTTLQTENSALKVQIERLKKTP